MFVTPKYHYAASDDVNPTRHSQIHRTSCAVLSVPAVRITHTRTRARLYTRAGAYLCYRGYKSNCFESPVSTGAQARVIYPRLFSAPNKRNERSRRANLVASTLFNYGDSVSGRTANRRWEGAIFTPGSLDDAVSPTSRLRLPRFYSDTHTALRVFPDRSLIIRSIKIIRSNAYRIGLQYFANV